MLLSELKHISSVQSMVLPGQSLPWLLSAPAHSPSDRFLPVAWQLLLLASTIMGLPTPHLGWWQWKQAGVRYIFWYSSPPSLTSWLFLLNPNTEHWMIGPTLLYSCLLHSLSLTEDLLASSDFRLQYMPWLSRSLMVRKVYKFIYFYHFIYVYQLVIQQPYVLVLIFKPLQPITAHQQMLWDLNYRASHIALAKHGRNIQLVHLIFFSSSTSLPWLFFFFSFFLLVLETLIDICENTRAINTEISQGATGVGKNL